MTSNVNSRSTIEFCSYDYNCFRFLVSSDQILTSFMLVCNSCTLHVVFTLNLVSTWWYPTPDNSGPRRVTLITTCGTFFEWWLFDFWFSLLQMEKQKEAEKMKRDGLNDKYLEMLEKQRLYFKTVKEFKEVRKTPTSVLYRCYSNILLAEFYAIIRPITRWLCCCCLAECPVFTSFPRIPFGIAQALQVCLFWCYQPFSQSTFVTPLSHHSGICGMLTYIHRRQA